MPLLIAIDFDRHGNAVQSPKRFAAFHSLVRRISRCESLLSRHFDERVDFGVHLINAAEARESRLA